MLYYQFFAEQILFKNKFVVVVVMQLENVKYNSALFNSLELGDASGTKQTLIAYPQSKFNCWDWFTKYKIRWDVGEAKSAKSALKT